MVEGHQTIWQVTTSFLLFANNDLLFVYSSLAFEKKIAVLVIAKLVLKAFLFVLLSNQD